MTAEETSGKGSKPPVNPPTDVHEPSPVRSPDEPVPEEPPEPQEAGEPEEGGEPATREGGRGTEPLGAAGRSEGALEP